VSQFPPPYSPQQPAYGGYPPPRPPESPDELLAPARRAGTMMIVVGAMSVLCGLFLAWQARDFDASSAATPELRKQMEQQIELVESQTGASFQTLMFVAAFVPLAVGALVGGVGFFVRGGSLASVIIGAILVGGLVLVTGLVLIAGLIQGAVAGPVVAIASLCIYGLPLALLGLLFVWLLQAARAASRVALARQQYQAQLWQYQQYQQAYLQQGQQTQAPPSQGMGYHAVPPQQTPTPTNTASPPPPADSSSERKDPPDGAAPEG
jgi:hypothetical protein